MIINTTRTYKSIDLTKPPPKRRKRGKLPPSAWDRMRQNHLEVYPECRVCGVTERVVVHHLRYRGQRGKSEQPGDLMTLCSFHHDDLHRRHGKNGSLVEFTLAYVAGRVFLSTL